MIRVQIIPVNVIGQLPREVCLFKHLKKELTERMFMKKVCNCNFKINNLISVIQVIAKRIFRLRITYCDPYTKVNNKINVCLSVGWPLCITLCRTMCYNKELQDVLVALFGNS